MDNQNNQTIERTEVVDFGVAAAELAKANNLVQLNYEKALEMYTEQEKQEIMSLADQIDVKDTEHILQYGSSPLEDTFERVGEYLKTKKGSDADLQVVKEVNELAKKVAGTKDEFALTIKEPNKVTKFLLKLFNNEGSVKDKIQQKAVTSIGVIMQLDKSSEKWLEKLRDQVEDISYKIVSEDETISTLEKYIIAGEIAKKRIEEEMEEAKKKYEETGLHKFLQEYEEIKKGYERFFIKLNTLIYMRVIYSMTQKERMIIKESNIDIQTNIYTKHKAAITTFALQIETALMNAEVREIYEAQKGISKLNDELIVWAADAVSKTAEDTKRALYTLMNEPNAILTALDCISNLDNVVTRIAEEEHDKMAATTETLTKALEKIAPQIKAETLKIEATNTPSTGGNSSLKF